MLSEADSMKAVIGTVTPRDRDVWQAGRIYEQCLAAEPLQDGGEGERLTVEVVRADKVQIGDTLLTGDFASIAVGQINSYPFDFYSQGGSAPFLRCELPETPVLRLVARHPHQDVERERDNAFELLGEEGDSLRAALSKWQETQAEVERLRGELERIAALVPERQFAPTAFGGFLREPAELSDAVKLAVAALAPSPDDRGGER